MAVTPKTNIRLLKLPLLIDNKNQLTFSNATAQFNYFNSLEKLEIDNCSYQRKDDFIRFPAHIDEILEYNYCMYQNENYSDKWFYAFITNMRYSSNNMTEIYIKTDVWQTWQFDLIFKQSFIEREMIDVSVDYPGSNLLPEGLETGEFKVQGTAEFDELEPYFLIAYSGEKIPLTVTGSLEGDLPQGGFTVNGIPSSIVFLCVDKTNYNILMNNLQKENYSDYILTCFSIPKLAIQDFLTEDNIISGMGYNVYALKNPGNYVQTPLSKTLLSRPDSIDGYTPRNKKLLTYPYVYLGYNPANGSSKIFRYEDFAQATPSFKIISEVNPNPSIYFIPQNYRGQTGDSMSDIVSLNGYPTLSSRNDYYNSWLAQNSEIISLNMQQEQFNYEIGQVSNALGTAGNTIGSLASADIGGAISSLSNGIISGVSNSVNYDFFIKQQMAQIEKQKMLPDKVNLSGSNATLIGYDLIDKNIFTRYSIKIQFAERIDKFFDMYGYLINYVKVPDINNRPNWNYVKTIGANILGDIPQLDLQEIKNMFDNGVTFWHDTNTFLDYSQNNR